MFSKLGVYALITKLVLHFFLHAFCGGFFFLSKSLWIWSLWSEQTGSAVSGFCQHAGTVDPPGGPVL